MPIAQSRSTVNLETLTGSDGVTMKKMNAFEVFFLDFTFVTE